MQVCSPGTLAGTSPRTRGKLSYGAARDFSQGNIPAHAGKTVDAGTAEGVEEEHPRARGENFTAPPQTVLAGGTSPRTRGKP